MSGLLILCFSAKEPICSERRNTAQHLGLTEQAVAEMTYPTASSNVSTSSRQLDATKWLASENVLDGFGRVVTASLAEDGQHASVASFTIQSRTAYDGLGRVRQVSYPYRPGQGETPA